MDESIQKYVPYVAGIVLIVVGYVMYSKSGGSLSTTSLIPATSGNAPTSQVSAEATMQAQSQGFSQLLAFANSSAQRASNERIATM